MPIHELICTEVWGGNGNIEADIKVPGMSGVIYSSAAYGPKGGDVYYATACSSGLIARVCLADVVGHGEQVARVSGWLHDIMRGNMERRDPSRVFDSMNRRVAELGLDAMTTAASIHFHALRAELRYCYAGHPPVLVFRKSEGAWRPLELNAPQTNDTRNLPFGVTDTTRYDYQTCPFGAGSRLMLYSDGVLETPNPDGAIFGSDRLLQFMNQQTDQPVNKIAEGLIQTLVEHACRTDFSHDDVTFILLEVNAEEHAPLLFSLLKNQTRKLWRRISRGPMPEPVA